MRDDNRPAIGSTHARDRSRFGAIAGGDTKHINARLKWSDRETDGVRRDVTVRYVEPKPSPTAAQLRARKLWG